ncbi:LysM peptidoglycan-binding domain-containing protein [Staphylococcus saccharolyticus]|uniref:LysM peptidoglycan-binding domain-containing protein n=1 Tax=Staphylococcus saccharolyticus TaxID=33028 RepID=UPI0032DF8E23
MQKKYITAFIGTTAISALASTHAQAATTHTVKSGESVWSISHKYGISITKLKSLNGLTSNLIFPNQVLKVSGSSSKSSKATSSKGGSVYTVKAGDSLSAIAAKYGTTYQKIMQLNGLDNFFIYPGQKLKVPGKGGSGSSSASNSSSNGGYYTPVFCHQNLYTWGQCTWHVFNRRSEIGKGISTYWWNANNWDNASVADGYTIDYRPTVGSIAQTDAGYYGHVAFVERINSNGSILVSEMNWSAAPGYVTYRTIPAYQVYNYKYIH